MNKLAGQNGQRNKQHRCHKDVHEMRVIQTLRTRVSTQRENHRSPQHSPTFCTLPSNLHDQKKLAAVIWEPLNLARGFGATQDEDFKRSTLPSGGVIEPHTGGTQNEPHTGASTEPHWGASGFLLGASPSLGRGISTPVRGTPPTKHEMGHPTMLQTFLSLGFRFLTVTLQLVPPKPSPRRTGPSCL